MRVLRKTLLVSLICVAASAPLRAQALQPSTTATVPRLVPVAGVFTPADGRPPAPVETVTLSLYAEETGGSPVWEEVQNASLDTSGRYSILLGASLADGVPLDIFASGEARWLGIRFERAGGVEAPRTRLTSVPYALRAADAETLGGRSASAYMLAPNGSDKGGRPAQSTRTERDGIITNGVLPGATSFLAKYVNSIDLGASGVYESAGSVGLGTSSPLDFMHVQFTNTGGTQTGLAVQNLGNTSASYSGMLFYDQNGVLGQFQGFNNLTHEYRINNVARVSPGGAFNGSINFLIGNTSRFRVTSSGYVGIGTTLPEAPLEVLRVGDPSGAYFTTFLDGPAGSGIVGRRARGTPTSPGSVAANDVLLTLAGANWISQAYFPVAAISMVAGDQPQGEGSGAIIFSTNAAFGLIERMRINQEGWIGIGTPTPADLLHVNGELRVANCVKQADGSGIAGKCPSDRRFKRDITSFGAVLPAVAALRPVHYYWRASEFPEQHFGDGQSYGLIAQEVEEVLPELVATNADGYQAVDYSKLPLLTVQAIKELKAENDRLNTQNDAVQARVAELERLVKQLLTERSRF